MLTDKIEILETGVPDLYELAFKPEHVLLSKELLAQSMGYRKNVLPESLEHVFADFLRDVSRHLQPRGGFKLLNDVEITDDGFYCGGTFFAAGRIITRYLRSARSLAVFMVTAGPQFDEWSKAAYKQGNMLLAYTIDCAGSEIADNLAALAEKTIAVKAETENNVITNRLSPGYCGWDVSEQKKLFALMPENFCGITLTPSALMTPIKSVSGVIGIGKDVKKLEYQCAICNQENCFRRKKKKQPQG